MWIENEAILHKNGNYRGKKSYAKSVEIIKTIGSI